MSDQQLPPILLDPPGPPAPGKRSRWGRLHGSAATLAIAEAAGRHQGPVVVLTRSAADADRAALELGFFAAPMADSPDGATLPVLHFPDWETLPYDVFSPHQDIVSQRVATLSRLPRLQRGIVVVAAGTLLQRLAPRAFVDGSSLVLAAGDRFDITARRAEFEAAGYAFASSQVTEHGEFTVRGSLVDIFPMGSTRPYRIDLFDDEVESIRSFDPDTQLSQETLSEVELLPAREFPLTETAIRHFRQQYRRRFEGDPSRSQVYRDVSAGVAFGGIEYYLPLFFESTDTLFDYLPDNTLIAELDDLSTATAELWEEIRERFEQRAHDVERPVLPPDELFLSEETVELALHRFSGLRVEQFELVEGTTPEPVHNFATGTPPPVQLDGHAEEPAAALLRFLAGFEGRVLFVAESAGRRETLVDLLRGHGLAPKVFEGWQSFVRDGSRLGITVAAMQRGLLLGTPRLAVIAEDQLFGERVRQRRKRRADRDPESIIRDLTDLAVGAPVVHEEHGIGRYAGLETLKVGELESEFLVIEYADGDRLYVPVHALQLITRYTGAAPENAPLHRLGSDQWKKARRRAAERIRDVAAELLEINARRNARVGHAYPINARDYSVFASDFPFEETPDQARAIEDVLGDLAARQPMDRVVCGDVGFGKTEVAMRAAFVAAEGGRQTAVLVPTTLLAQQHMQSFRDRFADWPVRIEMLSRFRSQAQSDAILRGLADGSVDIVIGTHKLLQNKIRFKNLGLVIIDEEHRFGVRHKEALKALRAEVDVLTLTATPIPRTLNMAMGGLRELSLITTPPAERLAVKTFVTEWNPSLVREACLREIKRGGQVYFVNHDVKSIDALAEKLAALVPEATIGIGHGQLRERELERVMLDFCHRRFNLLLCTTIIESGIDVPSANTIIINRADRFGLAQLHQLRGRVGRSHHRAYAYLVAPPRAALTPDALKRLEAVESLEDLGAGFVLATHDLEIRGAGELLGAEQSGQIHEIGFTLYTELLGRAVAALKAGHVPDLDRPLDHGPEVDLQIAALLPEDYVPDVHLRLIMYKRIASAPDDAALRELQVEMIDRFGLLPEPAKRLFAVTQIKLKAAPLGISRINAHAGGGRIVFGDQANVDPGALVAMIRSEQDRLRLDGQNTLRFSAALTEPEARLSEVAQLVDRFELREPRTGAA